MESHASTCKSLSSSFSRFLKTGLLLCAAPILLALPSYAITIDEFDGSQTSIANPGSPAATSIIGSATAIGATRSAKVVSTSGNALLHTSFLTNSGKASQSQDVTVTGISTITWDGDNNADNLNFTGLGGINFTQDGSSAVLINVTSYDYPGMMPVTLTVTVYSSSTESSSYSVALNQAVNAPLNLSFPFASFTPTAGFASPANFNNVGAIQLKIDGSTATAIDLTLDYIITNQCRLVPNANGSVLNECGVCGTVGSNCRDCDGVLNGPKQPDRCGVCDGNGKSCLGCKTINIYQDLFDLDRGAKAEEKIIQAMLKRLKDSKDSAVKKYVTTTSLAARELMVDAWMGIWASIPKNVMVCTNTDFCTTISLLPAFQVYQQRVLQLRDLAYEVANKIIQVKKKLNSADKENLKKIDQLAAQLPQDVLQLPSSVSQCAP